MKKKRFCYKGFLETVFLLFGVLILSFITTACSSDKDIKESYKEAEDQKNGEKQVKDEADDDNSGPGEEENEPQKTVSEPVSAKDAFEDYVKNLKIIAGESADYETREVEGDNGYPDYETDTSSVPMGLLGYVIADFDNDGADELLTYETENPEKISYSVYEYDNGVNLADKHEIEDGYLSGDGHDTYSFMYGYDDLIRFAYYSDGGVWNTGDGQFVYFVGLKYENGKIEEMSTDGFAGSDVYDDGEFVSSLAKSGIDAQWDNLNELSFLKATKGARLFKIDVATTDTENRPDEWIPYLMHRHVDFLGHSTLEEAEVEADRIAHENYIFPDSSTRYLTEEDLMGKSNEELRIGRNEIAARHGRKFKDEELQAYFDSKSWYFGYCEPDNFNTEYMLNEIEKKNMDFIKEHEK